MFFVTSTKLNLDSFSVWFNGVVQYRDDIENTDISQTIDKSGIFNEKKKWNKNENITVD